MVADETCRKTRKIPLQKWQFDVIKIVLSNVGILCIWDNCWFNSLVNEMSSDNPQNSVEKIKIGCPSCKSKLNVPANHVGKVSCPKCLQVFPFNSKSEEAKMIAKQEN